MTKKGLIDYWKKFWYILWKDESLKGWIISLAVLFIFIKFIFLPLLSLATGTPLPLSIVESCSMYHQGNVFSDYDSWWERNGDKYQKFNITEEEFSHFIFKRGFSKGDILFVTGVNPETLKVGDIIIFDAGRENPIIHRIINIKKEEGKYIFSTMGDNNEGQLSSEREIDEDRLVGKAVFRIVPYLGWGKLIFYEHLRPANERGLCKES
jgi:signal peptidase I